MQVRSQRLVRRTAAVEGHAAGTGEVMLLQTTLLNELLGGDIASSKKNGSGDGLGEQRPSGQPAVVPSESQPLTMRFDVPIGHTVTVRLTNEEVP